MTTDLVVTSFVIFLYFQVLFVHKLRFSRLLMEIILWPLLSALPKSMSRKSTPYITQAGIPKATEFFDAYTHRLHRTGLGHWILKEHLP